MASVSHSRPSSVPRCSPLAAAVIPPPTTTRVVSFGDSLSDLGTYTPVTQIPLGQAGGRAAVPGRPLHHQYPHRLHRHQQHQYRDGLGRVGRRARRHRRSRRRWPASPTTTGTVPCRGRRRHWRGSCTAYGQGGARVTNPAGWKNELGFADRSPDHPGGRAPGTFRRLQRHRHRLRLAGGNDFLVQSRDLGPGLRSRRPPPVVNMAHRRHGAGQPDQEPDRGQRRHARGGHDLAGSRRHPGLCRTARGNQGVPDADAANAFNGALLAGLAGTNVQIIDVAAWFADVVARPAAYGFANVTTTACDPAKMSPAGGRLRPCSATPHRRRRSRRRACPT